MKQLIERIVITCVVGLVIFILIIGLTPAPKYPYVVIHKGDNLNPDSYIPKQEYKLTCCVTGDTIDWLSTYPHYHKGDTVMHKRF